MNSLLDDVSRIIASPAPRRQALRLIGGAVFASLGLGKSSFAWALQPVSPAFAGPCPTARQICGTACCNPGQVCCSGSNGEFCCNGSCCGNAGHQKCCTSGQQCCGSMCCAANEHCCSQPPFLFACCPLVQECCNVGRALCCPPSQPHCVNGACQAVPEV
jgi:hypothetical protein